LLTRLYKFKFGCKFKKYLLEKSFFEDIKLNIITSNLVLVGSAGQHKPSAKKSVSTTTRGEWRVVGTGVATSHFSHCIYHLADMKFSAAVQ